MSDNNDHEAVGSDGSGIENTSRLVTDHDDNDTSSNTTGSSYMEIYNQAITMIETDPIKSLDIFKRVQYYIVSQSLFTNHFSGKSSETIDDVSTSSLQFITIEYYMAVTYMQLPTNGIHEIHVRQENLFMSCTLFNSFLRRLEMYNDDTLLSKEQIQQYHTLVQLTDEIQQKQQLITTSNTTTDIDVSDVSVTMPASLLSRDYKITQYQHHQQQQKQYDILQSLLLRRKRLHATINDDEIIDGYDHETLIRTIYISSIHLAITNTFKEWVSILQELPMISIMMHKQQQQLIDPRYYKNTTESSSSTEYNHNNNILQQRHETTRPLQVTQVSCHPKTGQLVMNRQHIQSKIFRPSWNQPTMSLDELAQQEVDDAIQRQQQQSDAEIYNKTQPRRYEQLMKDGMEDDIDLVDASAKLDREWDIFKDENPRGSGNKRGDVGDRNF